MFLLINFLEAQRCLKLWFLTHTIIIFNKLGRYNLKVKMNILPTIGSSKQSFWKFFSGFWTCRNSKIVSNLIIDQKAPKCVQNSFLLVFDIFRKKGTFLKLSSLEMSFRELLNGFSTSRNYKITVFTLIIFLETRWHFKTFQVAVFTINFFQKLRR